MPTGVAHPRALYYGRARRGFYIGMRSGPKYVTGYSQLSRRNAPRDFQDHCRIIHNLQELLIISYLKPYIVDIESQAFRSDVWFPTSGAHLHDHVCRLRVGIPALLNDRHHLAFGISRVVGIVFPSQSEPSPACLT